MNHARRTVLFLLIVSIVVAGVWACSKEPPKPIVIAPRTVTISNLTDKEWRQVEIWMNNHYRVTKPSMAAGERFSVPLDAFVAGFGQRFDPVRQVVQGIEVTATTTTGTPVRMIWGKGRIR
jgi:hypothetical protein